MCSFSSVATVHAQGSTAATKRGAVSPERLVDLGDARAKMKFVTDGDGHYAAFVPLDRSWLFWGDGRVFHMVPVRGDGSDGDSSFNLAFEEYRADGRPLGELTFRDGRYTIDCDERVTDFRPVAPDVAQRLLAEASFEKPPFDWGPYALARDDGGTYYFIDRQFRYVQDSKNLTRFTWKRTNDFRLFAGPRGALKPLRLTNVVTDSEGDIFATKTGQLRLILSANQGTWIVGQSRRELTIVPVDRNQHLIYTDLGPYIGVPLGTPCDVL